MIASEVADQANAGSRPGPGPGAITAALFLRRFVGSTPWAHLDIAGAGRSDAERDDLPKGGTGFGARALLRWLEAGAPAGLWRAAGRAPRDGDPCGLATLRVSNRTRIDSGGARPGGRRSGAGLGAGRRTAIRRPSPTGSRLGVNRSSSRTAVTSARRSMVCGSRWAGSATLSCHSALSNTTAPPGRSSRTAWSRSAAYSDLSPSTKTMS